PHAPAPAAELRERFECLQEHIFSDKPFQFPPELLRRLAVERWHHWGTQPGSTDFPLHDRILGIQQVALNELLSSGVLRRIQNNALKTDKNDQPLVLAEVFRSVTDGVWCDLPNGVANEQKTARPNGAAKEEKGAPSTIIRRNLQREHVKKLSGLVLGQRTSS